jgi:prepilin-type N-terminal cleavage/methylation domain-containing protein
MAGSHCNNRRKAFTLIELSIVLIIIGLVAAGILVGQDLINGAAVRAQISQIQRYQAAVHTFQTKYNNYLPGDIPATAVSQFGFSGNPTRSGVTGDGDGNGELDGSNCCTAQSYNQGGETLYFWVDLSTNSGLIEGGFNSATGTPIPTGTCTSNATCSVYFPYAKIGNGAFVYVYSGYASACAGGSSCPVNTGLGPNFFGISVINSMQNGEPAHGAITPAAAFTENQAWAIDSKIDDGLPTTGNVLAQWLARYGGNPQIGWSTNGSSPSSSTCYDTSSGVAKYSTTYNGGNGINCGISFQFQ